MPANRILVSGASGLIGRALLPGLQQRGFTITRLTRGKPGGSDQICWDPLQPLTPELVSGFDAVIHLAGESIVGRWTEAKKKQILDSRVQGTQHLAEALAKAARRPQVFISGSAIGYYGDRGDEILREESASGQGFLPEACRQWEAAAQPAAAAGIRTVNIRTGVVLSSVGGALQKMLWPFKMGLGGIIGSGRQWWSWIDVQDMVGAIEHIRTTDLHGPVNLVAPNAVTNAEFTKTLAATLHRPAIFPMPAFAARLAFGQMADELLLASQRVEPVKLVESGYSFHSTDLASGLARVLGA
jgi:hypothetical protein